MLVLSLIQDLKITQRKGRGRKEGGRQWGKQGHHHRSWVVVQGHHCACHHCECGVCMLMAIAAAGGLLSIHGCLCALIGVVGRVVAWWVLTTVDQYGVGGVGLVVIVCGWFLPCLSLLAWAVIVGGRGMSVGDGCGWLLPFAVVLCDDEQ
jgi:hypothetical protein